MVEAEKFKRAREKVLQDLSEIGSRMYLSHGYPIEDAWEDVRKFIKENPKMFLGAILRRMGIEE